ncbi:antitoxin VapB family protein [Saccharolobus islandicus]|uniref:antitoxin VapB family protein n=1 Tax=Saccharolobus islandicus TaxID=43080 RepID=UPI003D7E3C09
MYTSYMKTIMIRDDVYKKLVEIKGDKSFSEIIEELIEESLTLRRRKLEKYFGILNEEQAEEIMKEIKEVRKITDENINRKLSNY